MLSAIRSTGRRAGFAKVRLLPAPATRSQVDPYLIRFLHYPVISGLTIRSGQITTPKPQHS